MEELLDRQPDRALLEGSMHFEVKSAVYQTLRGIAARLDELQVPYAVAGGMALFAHGEELWRGAQAAEGLPE